MLSYGDSGLTNVAGHGKDRADDNCGQVGYDDDTDYDDDGCCHGDSDGAEVGGECNVVVCGWNGNCKGYICIMVLLVKLPASLIKRTNTNFFI